MEGIDEMSASAQEGVGSVTVEILEGENIQRLAQDIQNEVDRISSFPVEAEDPVVVIAQRKRYVVPLALYGDQSQWVLREAAEDIRDRLIQDPDITQVELEGIRNYEISIEISQSTLRAYNLTLEEVAQRIGRASVELPAGAIKTESGDILVRMKERRDYGYEFGKIPIITANDGTEVLLENMAVIKDGFEETDNFATYNGKAAVMITVYRVGDQTPIGVSDAVRAASSAEAGEIETWAAASAAVSLSPSPTISTCAPSAASASARLAATVDLPTPPLPEATAMMFLMLSMCLTPFCTLCAATLLETSIFAVLMPSIDSTSCFRLPESWS